MNAPAGPAADAGPAGPGARWLPAHRQELLRGLAAVALSPPPGCAPAARGLGLAVPSAREHTAVFVLGAPAHAAIHLGPEGMLGGEALDRVAGFWRVLGLTPPADADHLGTLLLLLAELGDAVARARSARTAEALRRARSALVREHLWSWAPGYLSAVSQLDAPALAPWARLTLAALAREARQAGPARDLPLALRCAPPPPGPGLTRERLLGTVLAPVRSGIVLTRDDLRAGARAAGTGCRAGERRFTLGAMLDQEPAAVLGWLSRLARDWSRLHRRQPPVPGGDPREWWAGRAAATAGALEMMRARYKVRL
jgi:hypothetical protein